jgi:hypothetical protein
VVRTRGGRLAGLAGLAGLALVLAVTASACSSGSHKPTVSPSHQIGLRRDADASALLAQCTITRGAITRGPITRGAAKVIASARQHSSGLPHSQQWLRAGQIALTKNNYATFNGWYSGYAAGIVVGGKSLDRWGVWAAQRDKLPAAVCGTGVSARSLHDQVFAHDPQVLKNNPWGS